jgi:hypothetical protein
VCWPMFPEARDPTERAGVVAGKLVRAVVFLGQAMKRLGGQLGTVSREPLGHNPTRAYSRRQG